MPKMWVSGRKYGHHKTERDKEEAGRKDMEGNVVLRPNHCHGVLFQHM